MSAKIFISYGEEDYKVAKRLYDDLKVSGFDPWMDKENILGGRNRKLEIRLSEYFKIFFLVQGNSTIIASGNNSEPSVSK